MVGFMTSAASAVQCRKRAGGLAMAMELWVLSDRQLQFISEWQNAIDAEGFPLTLSDETPLENIDGYWPARLRDQTTGFECSDWPAVEFMGELPTINFGHTWKYVRAFRWGGDFNELRTAWIAGAAYARATEGVVFDDQEGLVRNAEQACAVARREYEAPDPEIRMGTIDKADIEAGVDQLMRKFKIGPYGET
jgi:hypothetical protein